MISLFQSETNMFQTQQFRKQTLFKFCMKKPTSVINDNYKIYSDTAKLLYCFIPKVASTTWKRLFQVFNGNFSFEKIFALDKNKVSCLLILLMNSFYSQVFYYLRNAFKNLLKNKVK